VLDQHSAELGDDFTGYRNHAYRVANLCLALRPADDAAVEKVAIAAAYHDIGIWSAHTFDYLAPSSKLACDHLACAGHADWERDVAGMIREHHKIRAYRGDGAALIEPFRRADWIDVSRGVLSFGLPRRLLRAIFTQWPNSGFHRKLVKLTLREARAHPFRPLPVLKW
jgi:hypothetical protein